jgi:hypothetical protein
MRATVTHLDIQVTGARQNIGDEGDVRRSAHNPATTGTPRRAGTWPERGITATRKPASGALREACSQPVHALAAPLAPIIALMARATLGRSGVPFHEPFHAQDL